jgi:hypothetical protein
MARLTFTRLLFAAISSLAMAMVPATSLAQRGGGHGGGGGGSHGGGGGGFHGGGGFSGGGGSRGGSYSAPSRSYGGSFSRPTSAPRPSTRGFAAPSYAPRAYSSGRVGSTVQSAPNRADGQWHAFGGASSGAAGAARSSAPASSAAIPRAPGASIGNSARTNSTSRSSVGQGNSVWETTQRPSLSVVSHARVLSNIAGSGARSSVGGFSAFGNRVGNPSVPASRTSLGIGSSALLSSNSRISSSFQASSRFTSTSGALGANRSSGFAFDRVGIVRPGAFGANNLGRFGVHGPICFRCGVGLGFGIGRPWGWGWRGGWGFGWGWGWSPWLGVGLWDPFWFDPWYSPWAWGGYDYYSYPPDNNYSYDDPNTQLYANPDQGNDAGAANPVEPNPQDLAEPNVTPDSIPSSARVVQLYMKNGAMVTATDFWIEDDKLHYALGDSGEITINLDQLDLQRTVQENAKRGIQFTLKAGPGNSTPVPTPNSTQPPAGRGTNGTNTPAIQGTVNRI